MAAVLDWQSPLVEQALVVEQSPLVELTLVVGSQPTVAVLSAQSHLAVEEYSEQNHPVELVLVAQSHLACGKNGTPIYCGKNGKEWDTHILLIKLHLFTMVK